MGKHIVKAPLEYSMCTGCVSCEMICSIVHEGFISPETKRLFFKPGPIKSMIHEVYTCQQCDDHPCVEACPKHAWIIDENNIAYLNDDLCIGCGLCVKACTFDPPRIHVVNTKNKAERKAKKCDLCRTRPEGPACVEWCPFMCLAVSDDAPWEKQEQEQMQEA